MNKFLIGLIAALVLVVVTVLLILNFQVPQASAPGGGSNGPAPDAISPQVLLIPRWFVVSVRLGDKTIAAPEQSATLQFTPDGQVNGSGGCNEFSGTYQAAAGGTIGFGPVASTKMFCENTMPLENAYFEALSKVTSFSLNDDGRLVLSSADGQAAITLMRPPK